ncbi:raftlin-2 isoform X2 [Monodelphis domestica]|uniref:raftlin-2 isoform X2 n=1 Tax=Monodelphis domestica TaxID=13616 RepID=UPI0024E25C76|nr:raftlin-2 isoform X2 [Monodelphis domestica]
MGCGLRKLEDPDDSSPGKIFSTLKRPQVETKTDFAYEYVLLDFTLEASSNPEVIKISSILDIAPKVEEYYVKGYTVDAVHPVIVSVGRRRHLPASHLYRVVLSRLKLSQTQTTPKGQARPRLVIEECPLSYETLTNEGAKGLIEKINEAAKRGMKFVGFVTQHCPQSKVCNGTSPDGDVESESSLYRIQEHQRHNSDENCKIWNEGTLSGQSSESGIEEEIHHESGLWQMGREGSPIPSKSRKGEDNKLYTVFNVFDDESTCWTYQEGILSMKVTRKGSVISTLDADWLELTTFYYKQGLSLIDSFVSWETSKDHLSKSLEGLFIYEEEGSGVPGSNRKGNDAIVVEQWTVIEGCEIKTDYGPLLHTLAEFGWLLTSVLPTPILRHDSEGNLATKQVVFLQRPVMWNSAVQTPEKSMRQIKTREEKSKVTSRSIGLDTATSRPAESRHPSEECHLSPSQDPWTREGTPGPYSSFSGVSSNDSVLRELDDGQYDQEDGVTQVTCM